jgi:ubiquinone/menaquinone biosynthesis C-methylase UbiE
MNASNVIDLKKVKKDNNGIYRAQLHLTNDGKTNQQTWERIYNFNSKTMVNDRKDFAESKLNDHLHYVEQAYSFSSETVYLEIGCGPSYIAEYLMRKYNCFFIGVDFNYPMLVNLNNYLKKKKFKNYILLYADIVDMPIKDNSVDFVYGGGVIEHLANTRKILKELYRVLKKQGISFNTIPAFNLFWFTRFWNNIPSLAPLKKILEVVHIKIFRYSLLNKYHGYELSFTLHKLEELHKQVKFREIKSGSFAFHPSERKLPNKFLRVLYYTLSKNTLLSPVYYVLGKK